MFAHVCTVIEYQLQVLQAVVVTFPVAMVNLTSVWDGSVGGLPYEPVFKRPASVSWDLYLDVACKVQSACSGWQRRRHPQSVRG
jgi:hypothetical protein